MIKAQIYGITVVYKKIKGRINLPFSLANLIVKGSVVAITIITK